MEGFANNHIEQAKKSLDIADFPLDGLMEKLSVAHPDVAAELLDQWEYDSRRFVEENADVEEESFRKEMNLTKRFGLMLHLWTQENLNGGEA